MRNSVRAFSALAVTASFAVAVPAAAEAKSKVITMSGSTSVYPLASQLAKSYKKTHKGVKIKIAQGGSDVGVTDAAKGAVTIGMSSRDPKTSGDPGGLAFTKIARDAVCLITNSSNTIGSLSQAQVQGIFSGKIRDWSQVPGATSKGTINLVTRTSTSGTADAFQKLFMGSTPLSTVVAAKASNGLVQQSVKSDPNAVGYVSLDFTKGAHSVGYNGVACTRSNAKAKRYGAVRNFWFVTRGVPQGEAKKFISWVKTNKAAKKITNKEWLSL
ncbi:Phosphate ABC transporter periplasmic phosphate-binding protein PstS (TC 3.A.1.7.1) [Patulibacter medicamentivorans]|uniref:Phosphate ABC transporter periplasmic phosphate-binding protein PstS (TC 3.A.1.7.1) n=1 Tax=Patulibacter medicamentivorans TaxID=1097667 RepID=H0E2M6_9ACTN|nr:phosphate ABC transporter substrate-binding protein [Patulibacter medicamentivorans]EHN12077.1 Phosphate ABC transporter periplasmic phosphate-binding protein PstS (TC 3.A.1.7.1) [Patulibacter medicamentivorans]